MKMYRVVPQTKRGNCMRKCTNLVQVHSWSVVRQNRWKLFPQFIIDRDCWFVEVNFTANSTYVWHDNFTSPIALTSGFGYFKICNPFFLFLPYQVMSRTTKDFNNSFMPYYRSGNNKLFVQVSSIQIYGSDDYQSILQKAINCNSTVHIRKGNDLSIVHDWCLYAWEQIRHDTVKQWYIHRRQLSNVHVLHRHQQDLKYSKKLGLKCAFNVW